MTEQTKDGGPAFPAEHVINGPVGPLRVSDSGMSLRDWFAGMALQGLLPKLPLIDQEGIYGAPVPDKVQYNLEVAHSCYALADAMLAERSKYNE